MALFALWIAELVEVVGASRGILGQAHDVVFVFFLGQCLVVGDIVPLNQILLVRSLLIPPAVTHTPLHLHGLHKVDPWLLCFQHFAALTYTLVIFFQGWDHSWFCLSFIHKRLCCILWLVTIKDALLHLVFVVLLNFLVLHSLLFVLEAEEFCPLIDLI